MFGYRLYSSVCGCSVHKAISPVNTQHLLPGYPTYHENDSRCASKHVFTTNRTITLQVSLDTLVIFHGDIQTYITFFTMEKVLS